MSDNIPIEIQVEIIKRLPVKSVIQFRSVSKTWKSLISSSDFVAEYGSHHTQKKHLLVRYQEYVADYKLKYLSIVDDDTFSKNRVLLPPPVKLKEEEYQSIMGYSNGLFCFYCPFQVGPDGPIFGTGRAVLWNPSIRKAVDIVVPNLATEETYDSVLGFGVCRETNDSKIVKITHIVSWSDIESARCIPWQVELFTLSTGAWRSIDWNLPRKLIRFVWDSQRDCCSVVIHGVLYWFARTSLDKLDGGPFSMIISFDITSEEFGEVSLPNRLGHIQPGYLFLMSELRESLVVIEKIEEVNNVAYDVWMMEGGVFTKQYSFDLTTPHDVTAMGFRKNGELIMEVLENDRGQLIVYDPDSNNIDDHLEFDGMGFMFFAHSYMETLLLLDRPDLTIHNEEILNIQDDLAS